MKKLLKIFMIALITLMVLILFIIQYKLESYRVKQIKQYGILLNRPRLSYEPALFYYLFDRKSETKRAFLMPYMERKLKEFSSNGLYDEYIVKCYYTDKEREEYLNSTK